MKKNKKIKIVSLNDWHVPYEDPKTIALQIAFCKAEQPAIVILHELHDFYAVSKFAKDPKRAFKLQDEIDKVNEYLEKLRNACPKARLILLNSNHLDRLRKFLWSQAPALESLRALKLKSLLELEKYGIELKDTFTYKRVLFKHGNIVRKFAGYSAKNEFEREGCSGVSGHTHRLGVHFRRLRGGFYVWIEAGCACKLDAEYIEGIADWQQGFAVICFDKNSNHFYPTVVPIIEHRLDWGDRTFR